RALGVAARQTQREHRRLGAGGSETQPLDARKQLLNEFGPTQREVVLCAVVNAARHLLLHGCDDSGVPVAEQQRTMAVPIVDEFVPIDIPFMRSGATLNEEREWLAIAAIVRDAARKTLNSLPIAVCRAAVAAAKRGFD